MLDVTEDAKQLLKETLQSHSQDPETGIRLSMKAGGDYGIELDVETKGDQVVKHDGAKVLLVSSQLATVLEGARLDVHDTDDGRRLFLSKDNPGEGQKSN
jgi:Fe-S cluster assembly iron-binding protein IscA